jgi:hypothetical protein
MARFFSLSKIEFECPENGERPKKPNLHPMGTVMRSHLLPTPLKIYGIYEPMSAARFMKHWKHSFNGRKNQAVPFINLFARMTPC